ncbi:MAG: hypothetical protein D6805_09105 [Planctomycetota bacterium]|nr:MAG: hypothetical protein D6805_09105 [Planctomycetota bacterium]
MGKIREKSFWEGVVGGNLFLKKGSPYKGKFLEVRNLFLKKVPRRKVFGKSENLFSKRFSGRNIKRGFKGKDFSSKCEEFLGGGGRGNTFF